jgi:molecular chaperone HtpG
VWSVLTSIAASEKDRTKKKGFRGIGRLGGLAYCDELVFETSAKGEKVRSVVRWDAKKQRQILSDTSSKHDVQDVILEVASYTKEAEDSDSHFFKVTLNNVTNETLLDVNVVRNYLSMVSPVPIDNKFLMKNEIYSKFAEKNIPIDEYRIYVNTEQLYKPYSTRIYNNADGTKTAIDDVFDIKFIEFNEHEGMLAFGWYGISKALQQIPSCNLARGIRLRKGNIQIGEDDALQFLYKQRRFHYYFVGEIHAVSHELIPNARRDYFDESHALKKFEKRYKEFVDGELYRLTYDASSINAASKKIEKYKELEKTVRSKNENGYVSKSERDELTKKLDRSKEEAEKAKKDIEKLKEKAKTNQLLEKIIDKVVNDDVVIEQPATVEPKNSVTWQVDKLSKLNKKERKIVSEIYEVIRVVLTPDLAQNLIVKIEEKFK